MPSHAQLAARLMRDAAQFFTTVGEQNQPLQPQMEENAAVFVQVAELTETNPIGTLDGQDATHATLAARLMRDAAQFFRTIGEQNQPLKPQMEENATVFEQVANLIEQDPNGKIEADDEPPPAA